MEKPVGAWNNLDVIMAGDTMEVRLNGVTVSRAQNLSITRGKIQFQSEGAECLIRKVILHPLE